MSEAILDPLRAAALDHGGDIRWGATVVQGGERPLVLDDLDGDAILPTASIGKLFLLLAVVDDIDTGRLNPDEVLTVGARLGPAGRGRQRQTRVLVERSAFVSPESSALPTFGDTDR